MRCSVPKRTQRQDGFSLIELLVVILIIGILAAIAIPTFLGQKSKATDTAAKEMARTGALAAETFAADHDGSFEGVSGAALHELEPAVQVAAGGGNTYLRAVEVTESGKGFVVTALAPSTGDTFSVTHTQAGEMKRTCTAATSAGSCQTGDW